VLDGFAPKAETDDSEPVPAQKSSHMSITKLKPRLSLAMLFIASALSLDSLSTRADDNVWTGNGPFGGKILALVIAPSNPQVMYAGSETGGVFVSSDGAANWKVTSLVKKFVTGLAVDPHDASTVYAGVLGGVFKTTDSGARWSDVTNGLPDLSLRAVAIDPSSGNTVYAGTDSGVFKTTNGGGSWTAASSGLASLHIGVLQFNPSVPGMLFAGTFGGGIHRTTDGGNTWVEINEGIGSRDIASLAIDPVNPSTMFGVGFGAAFKTADGGATWKTLNVPGNLVSVAIDPSNSNAIYIGDFTAGTYRSTNAGENWSLLSDAQTDRSVRTFAVGLPGSHAVFLGGDGGGIFKSVDQGNSWVEANNGLSNTDVRTLALNSIDPSVLYAGTWGRGLFKSTNKGGAWMRKPGAGAFIEGLAIDPSNPSVIYSVRTPLKSTDAGESWTFITAGLIDPVNPSALSVLSVAIDPSTPNTVYAGAFSGVFKSTNGGREWKMSSSGIFSQNVACLAIDPTNSNVVYAGTSSLYKSTDGGANWGRLGAGGGVRSVAIDPSQPSLVYAVGFGGAFGSTDSGDHWTRLPVHDGSTGFLIYAVAVAPSSPNVVYAGTSGGGVFRSADRGATWSQINDGLTNLDVRALAVAASDANRVYAATAGGGVFSIDLRLKPKIASASISGKNLIVAGENFLVGAKIVMNGDDRKTLRDDQNPNALIGKKLGKQIERGDTVRLQVRNPDGELSNQIEFTRPAQ